MRMEAEMLSLLEQKIAGLIELIKALRCENSELKAFNKALQEQVDVLQASLLEKPQELGLTKAAVDELIKNIDILIEHEQC
jgi:hypothetical protein